MYKREGTDLIKDFLVGLGLGLGVNELLLTGICMEGEKHCYKTERTLNINSVRLI